MSEKFPLKHIPPAYLEAERRYERHAKRRKIGIFSCLLLIGLILLFGAAKEKRWLFFAKSACRNIGPPPVRRRTDTASCASGTRARII